MSCFFDMLWSAFAFQCNWMAWGILVIPLAIVLVGLVIRGKSSVTSYHGIGRIHCNAGIILVLLSILLYFAFSMLSETPRQRYVEYVTKHVRDTSPGANARHMDLLAGTPDAQIALSNDYEKEQVLAILTHLQTEVAVDDEKKEAFNAVIQAVMESSKVTADASVRSAADQGDVQKAVEGMSDDDSRTVLGAYIKKYYGQLKGWFQSQFNDPSANREKMVERRFNRTTDSGNAEYIAYRTGYDWGKNGKVMTFFVSAFRWFRGLPWCLIGVVVGIVLILQGAGIMAKAKVFQKKNSDSLRRICAACGL